MKRSRLLLAAAALALAAAPTFAGPMAGAIFTTTVDGSRVNANLYADKNDVYLDGGPGQNAPSTAAALAAGDYYFQVTDPAGKVLLSTDSIVFRRFTVSADGVIVSAVHPKGVDADHPELGAKTVKLMPYADTPNNGGVYKVWVTPVERYAAGSGFFGFIPSWSKMDTFKVRRKTVTCTPSTVSLRKFRDSNENGQWDDGEVELAGWPVYVTDPSGASAVMFTPVVLDTPLVGTWTFTEDTSVGMQIVAARDGQIVSQLPCVSPTVTVTVRKDCGETHTVVYGNNLPCGCGG